MALKDKKARKTAKTKKMTRNKAGANKYEQF